MPVRTSDVIAADLASPANHAEWQAKPGEEIVVNWVMSPPAPGSGGHTTVFRMIRYLEERGYINRVYFYDPYRADHQYYESIVHDYYRFEGHVGNVDDTMEDAHAVVATSWPTAYLVYNARSAGKRFYFVQDFEPFFHPVSAASILAENTYRMGFHAITAGGWLAEKLRTQFGMVADHFDFGCDTSYYRDQKRSKRDGIAYYARRDARRGYELGIMALEILAKRRPDINIHFYGDQISNLPFQVVDHGWATPSQLNDIYNQCFAGLSLSLTNVSLVPHEMLAAGCIPVVNEAEHNRIVLNNSFVRYAQPTPQALAAELEAIANDPDFSAISSDASRSVRSASWEQAGASVEAVFRRTLRLPSDRYVANGCDGTTDISASMNAESL
ncbi:rhamnosyltransferase WsaF family glycosyltransferase [Microvirga puerhi]|uniref:Glycosyltransferase family 1 protein n=1 Tax=Microvirga puerhi TaxID=2876078 RepID=A0ABS7VUX4_9HYPH|nr:glycosyltransferase family 1 protein [Microvirga puerhi]MBZ6079383.1 glycosyltransferase family 1 protein [Microvirga puerhi]